MICLLFKQTRPELVLPASLAAGGLMLWVVLGELSPAVAQLQGWMEQTGAGEYAGMLLKCLGICYLAQLAADSCRDAGQSGHRLQDYFRGAGGGAAAGPAPL